MIRGYAREASIWRDTAIRWDPPPRNPNLGWREGVVDRVGRTAARINVRRCVSMAKVEGVPVCARARARVHA